ncbi:hypothetical protein CONPUDRAFT_71321 [Coniophora puteana RWD-64-598 SS2]|uniref:Uncharacterized protein n=1 Tax=Coniophora puteana (strain RWD-64-598) TaxID=741705 RepID=A0A5M3N139_CONPW|nr:uncharacterized protein CONPUDRAFT_71321 [Coniophora puteana RWD-64-598 SS2]EIW84601.1 hypothetical protein CONPUDRAFT_71321 [Coniophora puteana RWD-64-598 SS2]
MSLTSTIVRREENTSGTSRPTIGKDVSATASSLDPEITRSNVFKALIDSVGVDHCQAMSSHAAASLEAGDLRRFLNDASLMIRDMEYAVSSLNGLEDSGHTSTRYLSAVGRVPVEILTEIFLLARTRPQLSHPAVKQGFHASWNVAQLWNIVHVRGTSETLGWGRRGPDEMLSRTRSAIPHLVVDLRQAPTELLQRCISGRLSAFESRCRGVDLCAFSGDLSNRTSFRYSNARVWLARFRQLERLTLVGCQLDVDPVCLSVDWQRLTHLHVHLQAGRDVNTFLSVSQLPNLCVLVLDCYGVFLDGPSLFANYPNLADFFLYGAVFWHSRQFTHERLERVCIDPSRYGSDRHAGGFLDVATLPSLTELAIPYNSTAEGHLTGLLRRSECQLNRLQLIGSSEQEDECCETPAREMGERLKIPEVEYDVRCGDTEMMRELRAKWYELSKRWMIHDVTYSGFGLENIGLTAAVLVSQRPFTVCMELWAVAWLLPSADAEIPYRAQMLRLSMEVPQIRTVHRVIESQHDVTGWDPEQLYTEIRVDMTQIYYELLTDFLRSVRINEDKYNLGLIRRLSGEVVKYGPMRLKQRLGLPKKYAPVWTAH